MTFIKNKTAYIVKRNLADGDYFPLTNSEYGVAGMKHLQTVSAELGDVRDYLITGLSPETGGTLKISNIVLESAETAIEDAVNAVDPVYEVQRYEVVIFDLNGAKYLLNKANITFGDGETPLTSDDFTLLNKSVSLGDGTVVFNGYNADGEAEFNSIKSSGNDVSLAGGNITIEPKEASSVGASGISVYDGQTAGKIHKLRKITSTGNNVTLDGQMVRVEPKDGENLGNGVPIYKGVEGTSKLHQFYNLKSSSFTISKEISGGNETGNILIESPSIPALYVNNLYKPTYEDFLNPNNLGKGEGTLAKPYTDTRTYSSPTSYTDAPNTAIQNAKDAYIGADPLNPDQEGQVIVIQNNLTGYSFSGTFNASGIRIALEDGAVVTSTTTGKLLDMDNATYFDQTNAYAEIVLKPNSVLQIQGDGLFNSGNSQSGTTYATRKTIMLFGDGLIYSDTNNTSKYIINSDVANSGNNNDGNLTFDIRCKIRADFQGVYKVGGVSRIDIYNRLLSGNLSDAVNTSLKAFHQTGGQVRLFNGAVIEFQGVTRTNAITFQPSGSFVPSFFSQQGVFAGNATNLFNKLNNSDVTLEVTNSASGYGIGVTEIFESTNLWEVRFNQNVINSGNIDSTKVDLTKGNTVSSVNYIGFDVIETLPTFTSKQDAKTSGIAKNQAFLVEREVAAVDLQPNTEYKITTAGSPSLGTVGNYIIATGSETGTGKGTLVERCVMR